MNPLTLVLILLLLVVLFGGGGYTYRSYGGWGGYRSGPGLITVLLVLVLLYFLLQGRF
jgi:hypothetical protein